MRSVCSVLSLGLLVALPGCLGPSTVRVGDYRPQDFAIGPTYYRCLQQAQHPYAVGGFAAGGGMASGTMNAGVGTDLSLLCACMRAEGYTPRDTTPAEMTMNVVFLPLEIPFALLNTFHEQAWASCSH